ncbi:Carnitine monooxygenase oxygenase subunit [BD1-7 clade bacterium]|uniref:Carnitine monooxygenase oxygenase subunit n=1 Tax=BD1-7 clade bacterium TaxID=2029982 RepID=A0A5S9Q8A0_9GAMM|nr:Carnitine monooxygenase oxygenase subunit [BD1-7 clade bacterium]
MIDLLQQYLNQAKQPIESANSLPFAAYTNADVYEKEVEQIFHNSWVFICAQQELPNSGDYYCLKVAGESIMILHGQDGTYRALSNNCRHRGTPLLQDGFGNLKDASDAKAGNKIVCPYHAWTFSDAGELKGVPMQGPTKVDKPLHCLPRFALDSWNGLLFVHLGDEPAESLQNHLAGMNEYLAAYDIKRFTQGHTGGFESWQSNWKLAMENAMESYHLFKVHKETLETTTPTRQAYYIAGSPKWTLTGGQILMDQGKISQLIFGKTPEIYQQYVLISLPPSFVGILTYDSFDWIHVMPVSATESLIRSAGVSTSLEGYKDKATQAFTAAFFEEDKVICEHVQKGMSSRRGSGGKLVDMERIVTDFHQYLAQQISGESCGTFFKSDKADAFLNPNIEK